MSIYLVAGPTWTATIKVEPISSMILSVEGEGVPLELRNTARHGITKALVVCRRNGWPYPDYQEPIEPEAA